MPAPLGAQLQGLFSRIADEPMPSRLVDLSDALEEALRRGELHRKPCAR